MEFTVLVEQRLRYKSRIKVQAETAEEARQKAEAMAKSIPLEYAGCTYKTWMPKEEDVRKKYVDEQFKQVLGN